MAPASETESKKPRTKRSAPLLPYLVMAAALLLGVVVRWPEWGRSVESMPASSALRPSGEAAAEGIAAFVFGEGARAQIHFQAIASILALVAVGAAAYGAAGAYGATAALLIVDLDATQILATRVVSPVAFATLLLSLTAALLVHTLRAAKPTFKGMLVCGIFAGLACSLHPILGVLVVGILLATSVRGAPAALGGGIVGIVLGAAPIWALPPLGAALHDWLAFEQFVGARAITLDWLVTGDGASSRWPWLLLALFALVGALRGREADGLLAYAAGSGAALVGAAALAGASWALPVTSVSGAFLVLLAFTGAVGAATLAEIVPFGGLVAIAVALSPAAVDHAAVLDAIRTSPGIFAPAPAVSSAPASAPVSAEPAAPPKSQPSAGKPEVAAPVQPASVQPAPTKPIPTKPEPEVSQGWRAATAKDLQLAKTAIDGEGGMTKPTVVLDQGSLLLKLRLEHKNLQASMADADAARMCIAIVRGNPTLDGLRVRIESVDGRTLTNANVPASRVKPFIPKLDDPFEGRRVRDWWREMRQ